MINYLSGTIQAKQENSLTLNVNGVGYQIFVTPEVLSKSKLKQKKDFFCYLKVAENIMQLYGFEKQQQKSFFELLLSVSGVGPKSALHTLSIAKVNEIKSSILNQDPAVLTRVSGIGQKTAEKIVVELKNKIKDVALSSPAGSVTASAEAFDALKNLGYSNSEIRHTLRNLPAKIKDEDEIIKYALKNLGKKKSNK